MGVKKSRFPKRRRRLSFSSPARACQPHRRTLSRAAGADAGERFREIPRPTAARSPITLLVWSRAGPGIKIAPGWRLKKAPGSLCSLSGRTQKLGTSWGPLGTRDDRQGRRKRRGNRRLEACAARLGVSTNLITDDLSLFSVFQHKHEVCHSERSLRSRGLPANGRLHQIRGILRKLWELPCAAVAPVSWVARRSRRRGFAISRVLPPWVAHTPHYSSAHRLSGFLGSADSARNDGLAHLEQRENV